MQSAKVALCVELHGAEVSFSSSLSVIEDVNLRLTPGIYGLVTHDDAFAQACTSSVIDLRRSGALELGDVP